MATKNLPVKDLNCHIRAPDMYPENMNALVQTPYVIAPHNFACTEQTVELVAVRLHEQNELLPGIASVSCTPYISTLL